MNSQVARNKHACILQYQIAVTTVASDKIENKKAGLQLPLILVQDTHGFCQTQGANPADMLSKASVAVRKKQKQW
jgi:hypothetical protein